MQQLYLTRALPSGEETHQPDHERDGQCYRQKNGEEADDILRSLCRLGNFRHEDSPVFDLKSGLLLQRESAARRLPAQIQFLILARLICLARRNCFDESQNVHHRARR